MSGCARGMLLEIRVHDEPPRGRSNIIEGVTGNQIQNGLAGGLEAGGVIRAHDAERIDFVPELVPASFEDNFITVADLLEHIEMSVTMTCDDAVTVFARQHGSGHVTGSSFQVAIVGTLNDIENRVEARDDKFRHSISAPRSRCQSDLLFNGSLFIGLTTRRDVTCVLLPLASKNCLGVLRLPIVKSTAKGDKAPRGNQDPGGSGKKKVAHNFMTVFGHTPKSAPKA